MKRKRDYILREFNHTYPRHGGRISLAAPVLNMTEIALARALYRAKNDGIQVRMIDDEKRSRRKT